MRLIAFVLGAALACGFGCGTCTQDLTCGNDGDCPSGTTCSNDTCIAQAEPDAGFEDAGFPDAGFRDAGNPVADAGSDAGSDAGTATDAGTQSDAGSSDAGVSDAGSDAGTSDGGSPPIFIVPDTHLFLDLTQDLPLCVPDAGPCISDDPFVWQHASVYFVDLTVSNPCYAKDLTAGQEFQNDGNGVVDVDYLALGPCGHSFVPGMFVSSVAQDGVSSPNTSFNNRNVDWQRLQIPKSFCNGSNGFCLHDADEACTADIGVDRVQDGGTLVEISEPPGNGYVIPTACP